MAVGCNDEELNSDLRWFVLRESLVRSQVRADGAVATCMPRWKVALNQNGGAYHLTIKHVTYYTVPKLRAATRPLHVSAQCNNLHHHAGSCTCLKLLVSHRNTRQAMNAQCQHARCAGQRAQSHAAIERCKREDLSRAFAQALAASGLVVSGRAAVPGMAEVWRT